MSDDYRRPDWSDVMAKLKALPTDSKKAEYLREVIDRDREHSDEAKSPLRERMSEELEKGNLTARQIPDWRPGSSGLVSSGLGRSGPRSHRQKQEAAWEAFKNELDDKSEHKAKLQLLADTARHGYQDWELHGAPSYDDYKKEVKSIQREAFAEIRDEAEAHDTTAEAIRHLKSERDELKLLDDYSLDGWFGIVEGVTRKLQTLIDQKERQEADTARSGSNSTGIKVPSQRPSGNPLSSKEEREYKEVREKLNGPLEEQLKVLSEEMVKAGSANNSGLQTLIEEDMLDLESQFLKQIEKEEGRFDSPSEKVEYLEEKHSECKQLDFEVSWPEPPLRHSFQRIARKIEERLNYWQQRLPPEQKGDPETGSELESDTDRPASAEPHSRFRWQGNERTLVYLFEQLIAKGYLSDTWEGENLWAKVASSFVKKDGSPYDNQQLAKAKQGYLNK